jgi:hypothetical protein
MQAADMNSTADCAGAPDNSGANIRPIAAMKALDEAWEVASVLDVLSMAIDHLADTVGVSPAAQKRIESMNDVVLSARARLDRALGEVGAALVAAR